MYFFVCCRGREVAWEILNPICCAFYWELPICIRDSAKLKVVNLVFLPLQCWEMVLLFGFFFCAASILLDKDNGWEDLTFAVAERLASSDIPFAVAGRVAASYAEFSASAGRVAGRVKASDADTELVGVGGIPPSSDEELALIYFNCYLWMWMLWVVVVSAHGFDGPGGGVKTASRCVLRNWFVRKIQPARPATWWQVEPFQYRLAVSLSCRLVGFSCEDWQISMATRGKHLCDGVEKARFLQKMLWF